MEVTKSVNNRYGVNYIGKFSNSYILGSVMNYKSATGILIPLASSHHNLYDIYLLLCIQYKTPDDGQKPVRNM